MSTLLALITKEAYDLCDVPKCLFHAVEGGVCPSHLGWSPLSADIRARLLDFCQSGEMPRYLKQAFPEKSFAELVQARIQLQAVALGLVWVSPAMKVQTLSFLAVWEGNR